MKCEGQNCNAELAEGAKYCGACGTAAKEPPGEQTMAKCASCNAEQPSVHKHCVECGEAMQAGLDSAEYDETMNLLETMAKANSGLSDELEITPSADAPSAEELLGTPENSEDPINALPVVDAMLKSQNILVDSIGAQGREVRALRKENALLAKAVRLVMERNAELAKAHTELRDEVSSWGNRGVGRKSITHILPKTTGAPPPDTSDTSLRGEELMAKAMVAVQRGKLSSADVARLEVMKNRGASLDALKAHPVHRSFGLRLEQAFAEVTQ